MFNCNRLFSPREVWFGRLMETMLRCCERRVIPCPDEGLGEAQRVSCQADNQARGNERRDPESAAWLASRSCMRLRLQHMRYCILLQGRTILTQFLHSRRWSANRQSIP